MPTTEPSGTKSITEKANNIDVGAYKYADTTKMYTEEEYNSKYEEGYNEGLNESGILNSGWTYKKVVLPNDSLEANIILGFKPSSLIMYFNNGNHNIAWKFGSATYVVILNSSFHREERAI